MYLKTNDIMNKLKWLMLPVLLELVACSGAPESKKENAGADLNGTWKLVSAKTITGKDTLITFPVKGQEMIKMFNGTHFSFFKHDLKKGKTPAAAFDCGAGTYKLSGEDYTEHLAYCSYRDWENLDFKFKLQMKNDTLIQRGIEKIDSLHVNHEIIEIYAKMK